MCDKAILENGRKIKPVLDFYKSQKMCTKAWIIMRMHYNLSPIAIGLRKSVIKLSILLLLQIVPQC